MESLVARVTGAALTFVIGELQIVVHGGHELLHHETPDDGRQLAFAPHLPLQDLDVVICPTAKNGSKQRQDTQTKTGVKGPAMEG